MTTWDAYADVALFLRYGGGCAYSPLFALFFYPFALLGRDGGGFQLWIILVYAGVAATAYQLSKTCSPRVTALLVTYLAMRATTWNVDCIIFPITIWAFQRAQKHPRDHVLTERQVLRFLQHFPDGATSVQVEDHLHGTHGYQLLLDLQAKGEVHQSGMVSSGIRKTVPQWALGPAPAKAMPKEP